MALVHELSWSASRARLFTACPRRYYYVYYLSWKGWGRQADPERRRAYLLKKMTRMPMLAGDIVHRAIAEYFARRDQGIPWSREEATTWAVDELRAGYKQSRDGSWKASPAKSVRLAEHHYAEDRIDEGTGAAGDYGKRYVERMTGCLGLFFDDPRLESARESQPGDWLACEDMSTFELFDTKVFAVPDFAYWESAGGSGERGTVRILDWKTGRPAEGDRFQLEIYAFYAREHWGVDPRSTTAADVYLLDGEVSEVQVSDDVLESALARIESSIGDMRAVHFDADGSKGDVEAFPMVPEERAGFECSGCNFRELCDRA
ncbi:MAG: PD-(D/E)XK nuclease family protein [Planctomycetota bacterium]|nr:PD-(D/E)XK nuclease family protein [Planctomycetota bacterium]